METFCPGNSSNTVIYARSDQTSKWLLLVTPARIAYVGLLGMAGTRLLGATNIYTSLESPFELWRPGKPPTVTCVAIVPAYEPHRIVTPDRNIAEVLIESESVAPDVVIQELTGSPSSLEQIGNRILDSFKDLQNGKDTVRQIDLDEHFLGRSFEGRKLDPRIRSFIQKICSDPTVKHDMEQHLQDVGLSLSRFSHLFYDQMGTTLRMFRAWKRARSVMNAFKFSSNLLDAALNAGYADSTHFSHALRKFYGLSPRTGCGSACCCSFLALSGI